ncbi:MAG: hypothetical protein QOF01_4915 [Thermomicrobiales bacterium]|jgi:hypothetical protein|nr:hypothetical protein [Thermomicrobiales bacterium]
MTGTLYGLALVDGMNRVRDKVDGAITTGITPEPDGRTAPATPPSATDASSHSNLLSRAWRLAARPVARPKAANCPTC